MAETSKGSASGGGAAGEVVKQQLSTDARAAMNYPLVKQTDMVEEMRLEAIDVITSAMEKYCMIEQTTGPSRQYDAACKLVAQTMSRKYGPSWNCIIGSSFASEVVFQKRTSLLLYYGGQFAIMLGKNP